MIDPDYPAAPGDHCGRCCYLGVRSFAVGWRWIQFHNGKSYAFTYCEAHRDYHLNYGPHDTYRDLSDLSLRG